LQSFSQRALRPM